MGVIYMFRLIVIQICDKVVTRKVILCIYFRAVRANFTVSGGMGWLRAPRIRKHDRVDVPPGVRGST